MVDSLLTKTPWLSGPDFEIDHIGVAVRSIEEALPFYVAMGWVNQPDSIPTEVVPTEKVKVAFLQFRNQVSIELLEATSDDSTIAKFIQKRGGGMHHVCFRVKDIVGVLEKLKEKNIRLIDAVAKPGAHRCRVAFVHPSATAGVLIELSPGPRTIAERIAQPIRKACRRSRWVLEVVAEDAAGAALQDLRRWFLSRRS